MISTEGRVQAGLDEFMLRVGHLSVICKASLEANGNWRRMLQEASEILCFATQIPTADSDTIAQYLAIKGLCPVIKDGRQVSAANKEYRYPDLVVHLTNEGQYSLRAPDAATLQWQDICLASKEVVSKVGALTVSAKSGSKTGLSHVCDWAQFLDFIDTTGQLTPMGRLAVGLSARDQIWNPYIAKADRLLFAHQYFSKDIDIFSRLAPMILEESAPLTKSKCRVLFIRALELVCEDLENTSSSSATTFSVFHQLRDLERAAKKSKTDLAESSTAWHRAASRFETLTDFGLLTKGTGSPAEQYQYVYYPTERLQTAVTTLAEAATAEEWIEHHLADTVLGTRHPGEGYIDTNLASDVEYIANILHLPTTLLPIDCLVLGICCISAEKGVQTSLYNLRLAIENLPQAMPDRARLSRGSKGNRAEYMSWRS